MEGDSEEVEEMHDFGLAMKQTKSDLLAEEARYCPQTGWCVDDWSQAQGESGDDEREGCCC